MAAKKKPPQKAKPSSAKFGKVKSNEPKLPPKIFAQVSPSSVGGVPIFEGREDINSATVRNYLSEEEVVEGAVARLREAGFEILQVTPLTINIAGSPQTYRKAFDTNLVAEERPTIKSCGKQDTATFIDSPDTKTDGLIDTQGTVFEDTVEGVAIEAPRYPFAASMFAPLKSYWHLRLPGDVSLAANADRAHRSGITGKGVKVVMCDSGWYRHPYFVGRGYRVAPVVLGPGACNPLKDESGHGTGESANIFAIAPDIDFQPVKTNFVNSIGAFNAAVALKPDIITCSWGSSTNGPLSAADQALAAAVAAAVASGIIVIFSAGNGGAGFPGQHPDVITAGGVYMKPDETLHASNYASGFLSKIYPGRRVPDVCGLVGMKPRAAYIMLPVEPGDDLDVKQAEGDAHPNADETSSKDGWAAFSGTSAAAPQIAGACALIKQACPALKPADVKDVLMKTARDVTKGKANSVSGTDAPSGHRARVGHDLATGSGLVDAEKAVLLAKVRGLGLMKAQPSINLSPPPISPTPGAPLPQPIKPVAPQAYHSDLPLPGASFTNGHSNGQGLTAEDIEALGKMVINSDLAGLKN